MTAPQELEEYRNCQNMLTGELGAAKARYEHNVREIEKRKQDLAKYTERYLSTGVAVHSAGVDRVFGDSGQAAVRYFKGIAKSRGWPYIGATYRNAHTYGGGGYKAVKYVALVVPNNKRMENLVAGLMLIAHPRDPNGSIIGYGTLIQQTNARSWTFYFVDDDGVKLFKSWLEECKTNPVFRICMNR